MKPHPRIRKTIKWGGLVITVLLLVVWIGSAWRGVARVSSNWSISTVGGQFVYNSLPHTVPPVHRTWNIVRVPSQVKFNWWYSSAYPMGPGRGSMWALQIPMWPLVLLTLATTSTAWWLDVLAQRREREGKCPKCGYDRAGLASGAVCPECGRAAT